MINRRKLLLALSCLVAVDGKRDMALAQATYPERYVKLIVPNPPGGPGDVVARVFADEAAQFLGQSFVFDYRPGATTTIGTQTAARAEPDGYTILAFPSSGLAITVLRKKLPYNLEKDFKPILGVGSIPLVLVVRSESKFKSYAELAKGIKGGDVTYGSGGVGTIAHLSAARLIAELKGKATHVPYRGNADTLQAVIAGQIDFFFASAGEAANFAKAGGIRPLGVTTRERLPELPGVPTMIELGLADFTPRLWFGFLAPSHTPDDRVKKLYNAFAEAGKDPVLQKRLGALGFHVELNDGAALEAMMKQEAEKWQSVVAYNKITVSN